MAHKKKEHMKKAHMKKDGIKEPVAHKATEKNMKAKMGKF
jgi:hypothetical protein